MWERGEDLEEEDMELSLVTDLTLFDLGVRQHHAAELASAIRALVRKEEPPNQKIALTVKWMV